jgi:hypothetical protein
MKTYFSLFQALSLVAITTVLSEGAAMAATRTVTTLADSGRVRSATPSRLPPMGTASTSPSRARLRLPAVNWQLAAI